MLCRRASVARLCELSLICFVRCARPAPSRSVEDMPVVRLLQNLKVTPEESARLVTAYEETLKALRLVDRSDPLAELVATKVIEIGQRGLLDPAEISRLALEELGSA